MKEVLSISSPFFLARAGCNLFGRLPPTPLDPNFYRLVRQISFKHRWLSIPDIPICRPNSFFCEQRLKSGGENGSPPNRSVLILYFRCCGEVHRLCKSTSAADFFLLILLPSTSRLPPPAFFFSFFQKPPMYFSFLVPTLLATAAEDFSSKNQFGHDSLGVQLPATPLQDHFPDSYSPRSPLFFPLLRLWL